LTPHGGREVTFSVNADSGFTTILKGRLGNFSIDSNALSGGMIIGSNLDSSNYFYVGGNRQ